MTKTYTMSWFWIGIAAAVPIGAACLVALIFWLTRNAMMGNVIGAGVVLVGVLLSIYREAVAIMAIRIECNQLNRPCKFSPDDFTRYAIYAGIGFAQIFLLFMIGLFFEERQRRRLRSKAWR